MTNVLVTIILVIRNEKNISVTTARRSRFYGLLQLIVVVSSLIPMQLLKAVCFS